MELRKTLNEEEKLRAQALTDEEEKRIALNKVVDEEIAIYEAECEIELQNLKNKESFKAFSESNKDEADKIIANFNAITEANKRMMEDTKGKPGETPGFDLDALSTKITAGIQAFSDFGNSILSITSGIADEQIAIIQEKLEAQMELINAQYETAMEKLDEERNAALEAAGFIATTSAEGLEASMEAAMAS